VVSALRQRNDLHRSLGNGAQARPIGRRQSYDSLTASNRIRNLNRRASHDRTQDQIVFKLVRSMITASDVIGFVMEAMRKMLSGATGRFSATLALPNAPV
jgi:hypothetical protein